MPPKIITFQEEDARKSVGRYILPFKMTSGTQEVDFNARLTTKSFEFVHHISSQKIIVRGFNNA